MPGPDPMVPFALIAAVATPRSTPSHYPPPFAALMSGRVKRPLGDPFGIQRFGVNHVRLAAGASSALMHVHSVQDEWIYVLSGELTLIRDTDESIIGAGMCAGFAAGGRAHMLVNRTRETACYLEVGDRQADDSVSYPRDDVKSVREPHG
ncbi:cupin domain-containing protein [Massilia sp. PWRC2]|uniref:cupin domain-containing protein n=1 Tax=Massilia sp. PWRC2 TaxID=2804626 RepID=UPI003CFB7AD9